MRAPRLIALFSGALLAVTACSASIESGPAGLGGDSELSDDGTTISVPATGSTAPSSTSAPSPTSAPPPASAVASTTSIATTTTTTTIPEPEIFDPACVAEVKVFDSLGLIANRFDDETVNVVGLRAENDLPTADIDVGQLLDVCVGNGLNDLTGEQRTEPDDAILSAAVKQNVELQQLKLNRLFEDLGTPPLGVDGVSGPVTRQRLCAARLALGFEPTTEDMASGSAEERELFSTIELPVPQSSATESTRWVLIDMTCQVMFIGSGADELTFVFPTSTGSDGFETRPQNRSSAFRFIPATDNGGWHDSSEFPAPGDNPLNGNMYKPLYFDGGQAIHGANNVPTSPQSKGCARLRVAHMNALVDWLGLSPTTATIWSQRELGVTVNIQGEYVG